MKRNKGISEFLYNTQCVNSTGKKETTHKNIDIGMQTGELKKNILLSEYLICSYETPNCSSPMTKSKYATKKISFRYYKPTEHKSKPISPKYTSKVNLKRSTKDKNISKECFESHFFPNKEIQRNRYLTLNTHRETLLATKQNTKRKLLYNKDEKKISLKEIMSIWKSSSNLTIGKKASLKDSSLYKLEKYKPKGTIWKMNTLDLSTPKLNIKKINNNKGRKLYFKYYRRKPVTFGTCKNSYSTEAV